MVFIETSAFTRRVTALLTDEDLSKLQAELIEQPDLGAVIPEGRGIRKLRVPAKGHGKSGGARVIYYWAVTPERVLFLRIYAKSEKPDLTRKELKDLRRLVEEEFG